MSKKKLVFLWISRWRSLKDFGLNLSSKYIFSYDKDRNELSLSDNSGSYVDGFFGENIQATAIVGANGCGKTSILRHIAYICQHQQYTFTKGEGFFAVFCDETDLNAAPKFYLCTSSHMPKPNPHNHDLVFTECYENINEYPAVWQNFLSDIFAVYYTSALNPDSTDFEDGMDISTAAELKKAKDFTNYYASQYKKQIEFFANNRQIIDMFSISYCDEMNINFSSKFFSESDKFNLELGGYPDSIEKMIEIIVKLLIDYIEKDQNDNDLLYPEWFKLKQSITDYSNFTEVKTTLATYLGICKKKKTGIPNFFSMYYDGYIKKIDNIENAYGSQLFEQKYQDDHWVYSLKLKDFDLASQVIDSIYTDTVLNYIDLSWSLSSGEMYLLTLYSRLKYCIDTINSHVNTENVIILLDEAELTLHPEWQRKFIMSLIDGIPSLFVNPNTKIHFVIATHSPLILSDFPSQDVIRLARDESMDANSSNDSNTRVVFKENESTTFGANIYKLFNDSFFLEHGAIGAFAEKKIKEIIREIKNNLTETNEKTIIKEINTIGDGYIKVSLLKLLEKQRETDNA